MNLKEWFLGKLLRIVAIVKKPQDWKIWYMFVTWNIVKLYDSSQFSISIEMIFHSYPPILKRSFILFFPYQQFCLHFQWVSGNNNSFLKKCYQHVPPLLKYLHDTFQFTENEISFYLTEYHRYTYVQTLLWV